MRELHGIWVRAKVQCPFTFRRPQHSAYLLTFVYERRLVGVGARLKAFLQICRSPAKEALADLTLEIGRRLCKDAHKTWTAAVATKST